MFSTWTHNRTVVLLQEGEKSVTSGITDRADTHQVFVFFLHLQHCLFLPKHQDKVVHLLLTQLKHHCLYIQGRRGCF